MIEDIEKDVFVRIQTDLLVVGDSIMTNRHHASNGNYEDNDPVIVFEDLKDMRDSIDYGTRMNRRLHSLPFAALQEMVEYKAAWEGILSDDVDPEYTSQRCPRTECQHIARGNRHKKRFKCCECEFQDHADRKAAVCVVQEWVEEQYGNVPSLDRLPGYVRVMRRAASGAGGGPDSHGRHSRSGVDRHGTSAQPSQGAREELNSGASAVQD
jgi:IS605 OrfB family transposase